MADVSNDHEQGDPTVVHGHSPQHAPASKLPTHDHDSSDDGDDDDEEEEDEPRLKYNRLTGSLSSIYRGGDATSAFLVAGDKMVCMPLLLLLRVLPNAHRHVIQTY